MSGMAKFTRRTPPGGEKNTDAPLAPGPKPRSNVSLPIVALFGGESSGKYRKSPVPWQTNLFRGGRREYRSGQAERGVQLVQDEGHVRRPLG